MTAKRPYQPPYAEIVCVEARGVLCHSAIVAETGMDQTEEMVIDTIRL